MLGMRRGIGFILLFASAPALAHGAHDDALGWTLDPLLTVPLGVALLIYCAGWARLTKRASTPIRPTMFLAGSAVLALSLTSPLHQAGERSFTMHRIEHELIMLVATLLLAGSGAGGVLAWGLPRPVRQSLGGAAAVVLFYKWLKAAEGGHAALPVH